MYIYITIILFCFLLSTVKLPKSIENSALVLIALFLCFGYMTGTDWYNYEKYYYNKSLAEGISKTREFGYFYLQTAIEELGVNFWIFHITIKVLVFYSLIKFIRKFDVNIFLFLALFIPEAGFYLFIDCPFRNLIAFGFCLIAFHKLFENKIYSFFIYVFIAINFHASAMVMLLLFFVYKKDLKTAFVLSATLIIYSLAFNIEFLITSIYTPLIKISPTLGERFKEYLLNTRFISHDFNIGSYIRIMILLILLLFKEKIISEVKNRPYILTFSFILLMLYPLGVSLKILQRFILYLFPFYTLSILYLLKSIQVKTNIYILSLLFVSFSLMQTYKTVSKDYRYVPYTNYLIYSIQNNFPPLEYRHQYNHKNSPYK